MSETSSEGESDCQDFPELHDPSVNIADRFHKLEEILQDEKQEVSNITLRGYKKIENVQRFLRAEQELCEEFNQMASDVAASTRILRKGVQEVRGILENKMDHDFLVELKNSRPATKLEQAEIEDLIAKAQALAQKARVDLLAHEELLANLEAKVLKTTHEVEEARREAEEEAQAIEDSKAKLARKAQEALEKEKQEEAERKRLEEEERKKREEEKKKREEEERLKEAERKREQLKKEQKDQEEQEERDRILKEKEAEKWKEEAQRRDPKNWPIYFYKVDPGDMNVELGCVVRAMEETMKTKASIAAERLDQLKCQFHLERTEELVSNIIRIHQTDAEEELQIEEPITVAIPHCAPKTLTKEPVVKRQDKDGEWKTIPTKEVDLETVKSYRSLCSSEETSLFAQDLRYVEVLLQSVDATLAVVTQTKRESIKLTRRGGKVQASVDPRISFNFKPGTCTKTNTAILKVQPVDNLSMANLKHRYPNDGEHLLAASPLISYISILKRFLKPVTVTVPVSLNLQRKARATTATTRTDTQGNQTRPRPTTAYSASAQRYDTSADELHLLSKDEDEQWNDLEDVELIPAKNKDIVTFDMEDRPLERFMILRMTAGTNAMQAARIADRLENSLGQKVVQIILGQNRDNPSDIIAKCVNIVKSDRIRREMDENGYETDALSSKDLPIREGQEVEMRFRGNVVDTTTQQRQFIYNTHIKSELNFFTKEKDKFAQRGIDNFRGFVQFFAKNLLDKPFQNKEKYEESSEEELLCEVLLNLPKPDPEEQVVERTEVNLRSSDILTNELLRDLAGEIGDEWRQVGYDLDVPEKRVQAILQSNPKCDQTKIIYDILLTWAKGMPRSKDKVRILRQALISNGRADLEEQLRQKDRIFRRERAKTSRDSMLRQTFTRVAQDRDVIKNWIEFVQYLGLSDNEIDELKSKFSTVRERCYEGLMRWSERTEEETQTELLRLLKKHGYHSAACAVY